MAEVERTPRRSTWPEVFDWFDEGLPALFAPVRTRLATHGMRIEELVKDDRYVLRAELPGIDPVKDVEVSVSEGVLTVAAERRQEVQEKGRSEFSYGSLVRRVALPSGAREDDVTASYEDGILEVSIGLGKPEEAVRRIPVQARGKD